MTLDLHKIAPQIGDMVIKLKSGSRERQEHIKNALDKAGDKSLNFEKLKRKIEDSRTLAQWPIAGLVDELYSVFPAPPIPDDYTVLATDGSHIDVDRNRAAHCYMINIGAVKLCYGANCAAELDSVPHLYAEENDLVICSRDDILKKENVQGALLDAKRSVEECRVLAEMASGLAEGTTAMALMDGSLIMFGLENYPKFVTDELLRDGFLKHLDRIMGIDSEGFTPSPNLSHQGRGMEERGSSIKGEEVGERDSVIKGEAEKGKRKVVLGSYISSPRSAHVVNALKVAFCPYDKADCEQYCSENKGACEVISGVQDKDLFLNLLLPGERSALFTNPSVIVEKYYGQHRVFFFYLRLEDEIARVEVPEWVVRRKDVELTHALVVDQCRRGQGYPVALSEAHEQAVVTGADREEFWSLVEESMIGEKISTNTSFKSRSKRTRWV